MKVLLAVSGGVDSMYLALHAREFFPGAELAVAHCNFRLRGEESDADESFVRDWCESCGMRFFIRRFDTLEVAAERSVSVEMAARDLRYSWFSEILEKEGFDAVAVAHNANDNAETLVLNLLRGTGTRGLRGMSPDSPATGTMPRILRPMLGIGRQEIEDWMRSNAHAWREDSTNAESFCKRNIIRNDIFPLFSRINPSFLKTLNEDAERIALTDDIAEDYWNEHAGDAFDIDKLLSLKHWEYVLFRATRDLLNRYEYDDLVRALRSGRNISGKRFGRLEARAGKLMVSSAPDPCEYEVEYISRENFKGSLKQPEGVVLMDADALVNGLKVRPWREGDWMHPLGVRTRSGAPGRKKLSDIFADSGCSVSEKASALVVELEGSHVAALLFSRIDEAVKVVPETSTIIRISRK